MEEMMKIVRSRWSIRTFDGQEMDTDDMNNPGITAEADTEYIASYLIP